MIFIAIWGGVRQLIGLYRRISALELYLNQCLIRLRWVLYLSAAQGCCSPVCIYNRVGSLVEDMVIEEVRCWGLRFRYCWIFSVTARRRVPGQSVPRRLILVHALYFFAPTNTCCNELLSPKTVIVILDFVAFLGACVVLFCTGLRHS